MNSENIILTGFMGTGKSTVGKLLAQALDYEFVDTDEIIMSRCGKTVAQIFETQGEGIFRKMEHDLALELSKIEKLVISTGGKMMLDSQNADTLGRRGNVFCLVATPDEIVARVSVDVTIERPLLQVENPKERILELLEERKEGYGEFTQIKTTGKFPDNVCREIMELLN